MFIGVTGYNHESSAALVNSNGVLVDFTIEAGHTVNDVLVILDGLILPPADYSINGTTLTFGSAPLNGQQIDIRYMPV